MARERAFLRDTWDSFFTGEVERRKSVFDAPPGGGAQISGGRKSESPVAGGAEPVFKIHAFDIRVAQEDRLPPLCDLPQRRVEGTRRDVRLRSFLVQCD